MEVKVNIPFKQLLVFVRQLSPDQKQKLKKELENEEAKTRNASLKELLLNGPVFTSKQIKAIENTRKSINEWRTK